MGGEQRDTGSSNPWWWVPNAAIAAAGVVLCGLGVVFPSAYSGELVTAGIAAVVAGGAHAAGKQSPTP